MTLVLIRGERYGGSGRVMSVRSRADSRERPSVEGPQTPSDCVTGDHHRDLMRRRSFAVGS